METGNNRYDSASYQAAGMWLQIELPKAEEVNTLYMDAGPSQNDFPKSYIVETSIDGKNWATVVNKGIGTKALTEIKLKNKKAKFIKVTLTSDKKGKYWSIHALDILAKK